MSRSRKILMLLGSYDSHAHAGIARAARVLNWHLDVSLLKTFQLPAQWRGDGIITSLNRSQRLVSFIHRAKLPTVDLSSWRTDIDLPRVVADNVCIGRVAAEHFGILGHHNFAWFALSRDPVGEARCKGFREALPQGVNFCRLSGSGAPNRKKILAKLESFSEPVAVFCKSDDDAAWLLNLCLDCGLSVPARVALLGTDNNRLICENQPVPLSSVNHDLERIGYEGALRLDSIINGDYFEEALLIPPTGVTKRQSTDALAIADPAIVEALNFMNTNYRRSIGTDDIAAAAALPRRSLEKRFKELLHKSVHEALVEIRLNNAQHFLEHGHSSMTDIAALCGFCNAPHFSRSFKSKYRLSPLKYRKQFCLI